MKSCFMKKALALFLSALLLALSCTPAFAAAQEPTISFESAEGKAGSVLSIPVSITAHSGIAGFRFCVHYDPSVFTFVSFEAGEIMTKGTILSQNREEQGEVVLLWYSVTALEGEGELAQLSFAVSEEARGRKEISVTYLPEDILKEDATPLPCNVQTGEIFISCPGEHLYSGACDASCNSCGEKRIPPHDYSNACDKTCNECGGIRAVPNHVYDNACDTDCNECGAERTVLPHDFSVRDKNETQHWMKCSSCGVIDEETRAAHTYDNACDTDCNVCGQVRTITHDFSVRDKSETEHWMKCSVCGAKDEDSVAAHIHGNACDTDCNVCGETREVPDHVYDHTCDTDCNECGETRTITHDFSVRDKDAETHWMKCSVCGAKDEDSVAAHIHDNACDTDCNVCGETREVPDHVYDDDQDSTCNECGAERATYTPGDLNGSDKVDSADAIYLLYYTLFGETRYPANQPIDYNKDGVVNSADAIYLLYHTLFGASRYPLVKQ